MALTILSKTRQALSSIRSYMIVKEVRMATGGIIVIGDEVLKGEIQDTNSNYLAVELHKKGIRLKKISVIGDNVEEVSREVLLFSNSFDHVLTTGGIGPTHDDITYEAVAKAFNKNLVLNMELKDICLKFYDTTDVNCPGMKMAYVPESAKLNFKAGTEGPEMNYPNVSVNNIYMFPGIPELMKKSFSIIKDIAFNSTEKFYSKCIYLNVPEHKIISMLDNLVREFPDVQFGSYPKLFHEFYKVRVTLESSNEKSASMAYNKLMTLLPEGFIVDTEDIKK